MGTDWNEFGERGSLPGRVQTDVSLTLQVMWRFPNQERHCVSGKRLQPFVSSLPSWQFRVPSQTLNISMQRPSLHRQCSVPVKGFGGQVELKIHRTSLNYFFTFLVLSMSYTTVYLLAIYFYGYEGPSSLITVWTNPCKTIQRLDLSWVFHHNLMSSSLNLKIET